jgi:hypothetical protein
MSLFTFGSNDITFGSNNDTQILMQLKAGTGYVGIGTTAPAAMLHVVNGTANWAQIGGSNYGVEGYDAVNSIPGYLACNGYSAIFGGNVVPLGDNDGSTIGTSSYRFSTVYAANGVITTSDEREKENIKDISYGLSEIMKLRPVSFTWKSNPAYGTKLGLIAQEVEPILGEVVKKEFITHGPATTSTGVTSDYRYGVYYSDIIPVLIKAVQELNTKNEELQKQIDELKSHAKN